MDLAKNAHQRTGNAVVLFAHGSRDPQWARPFRVLQDRLAARRTESAVELAFLEFMEPTLPQVVDRLAATGHRRITVAPILMAQGAHFKRDLDEMAQALRLQHAEIDVRVLPAAGEAEIVLDAISAWLEAHV